MHIREPSSLYLSAAQEIAFRLGLDIGMVANGHPIDYGGLLFWLRPDDTDPGVMAAMVEIGDLPVQDEARICRQLLQQHYIGVPAMHGSYCLLPGTDVIAYCVRFEIETPDAASASVLGFIDHMVAQKNSTDPIHKEFI